jgi:hypothetical protein
MSQDLNWQDCVNAGVICIPKQEVLLGFIQLVRQFVFDFLVINLNFILVRSLLSRTLFPSQADIIIPIRINNDFLLRFFSSVPKYLFKVHLLWLVKTNKTNN